MADMAVICCNAKGPHQNQDQDPWKSQGMPRVEKPWCSLLRCSLASLASGVILTPWPAHGWIQHDFPSSKQGWCNPGPAKMLIFRWPWSHEHPWAIPLGSTYQYHPISTNQVHQPPQPSSRSAGALLSDAMASSFALSLQLWSDGWSSSRTNNTRESSTTMHYIRRRGQAALYTDWWINESYSKSF